MKWKPIALTALWGLIIASWMALIAFRLTNPDLSIWTVAVTTIAVITEIGFWLTAAILGMGLWESRKRVFGFLAKPFTRG